MTMGKLFLTPFHLTRPTHAVMQEALDRQVEECRRSYHTEDEGTTSSGVEIEAEHNETIQLS